MPTKQALLPNPEVLRQLQDVGLSPETVVRLIDADQRRKLLYAITNSVMGGICFLAIIVAFVYLVMKGHPKSAGAVLAAGILAIIREML
jgi:hypothetical protein